MLDQAFTTENFRKLYDRENRRGVNLESRFFPGLADLTEEIRARTSEIKQLRRTPGFTESATLQAQVETIQSERAEWKKRKEDAVDAELEVLAADARADSFAISLRRAIGPGGKPVYPAEDLPINFFVLKQLQENLKRLYGVKQANRHHIVCQVRDTLNSNFRWVLVRTDIESFYESVDRQALLSKLSSDLLLSVSSKRHIRKILQNYGNLSGEPVGIPRGVGISAHLSELFMRKLDRKLRGLKGAVFYARYVDDIVIIFAPTRADDPASYEREVRAAIAKHGLNPNPAKTFTRVIGPTNSAKFDYLGYRFEATGGRCAVHVSAKKIARYKKRVELSFADFRRRMLVEPKIARRLLIARMRFLTGNTRLHNNKQHAMTGIFYSNSEITDSSSLSGLDAYKDYLAAQTGIASLQNQLAHFSFVRGFEERTFHIFTPHSINRIVQAWKYEEA